MYDNGLIGLALSGGGLRAALFHLGALWRLNELSLLPAIDRISAVSGGALLAGLVAAVGLTEFQERHSNKLPGRNRRTHLGFLQPEYRAKTITYGLLRGTKVLERHYSKNLVGKSNLQDIPDRPEFVFNAAI